MDAEALDPVAPITAADPRHILELLAECQHHKIDPQLLRVEGEPIVAADGLAALDVLEARGRRVGLRMVRVAVSAADLVVTPAHQLPLVVARRGGELGLVVATRGLRACVRWDEDEAWLSSRSLANWLGATDDEECVVAMGAELAMPLTSGAASHGPTGHHDNGHHRTSIDRLFAAMRLDRQDLFSVLIYAVFIGLSTLVVPVAVQAVVNTVAFGALIQPLVVLTALVLGFLAFNGLLRALQARIVERLQERMFVRAAVEFAHRIPAIEVRAFDQIHAPEKVNRFFDVMTVQKSATALLLDGSLLTLQAVVGLVLLGFYHPFLLAFDFVLLIAIGVVIFGLGRKAVTTSLDESAAKYEVVAWLQDVARSPVAFRLSQDAALQRTDDLARRYLLARRKHFSILFRQIVGSVALQAIASASLLAIGGLLVLDGQLTIGQLVAAELVVTSVLSGIAKLGKHLESFYDLRTGLEKIGSVTDLPLERTDAVRSLDSRGPANMTIAGVRFAHEGGPVVLDGFDLTLRAGEKLAVVGQHGSGKSSLADLLFGLRTASAGAIMLDGVDVRELSLRELRRHVALVRDVEIFEGSVFDNVALWRPHVTASDVHAALAAVGLSEAVTALKHGVKTALLTGGKPLSLGQAQRLMLARALAGKPRLVVIDGLLDGMDQASLHELEERLMLVCREKTSLLVLTSLEPVAAWCDRAVMLPRRSSSDAGVEPWRSHG